MIIDNMKATGHVSIVVKDADGNVKHEQETNNLVVTTGLDWIAARLYDTGIPADMSHMAIGTGIIAAAAGDTALGTQSAIVALTSTTVSTNTVQYVASFAAGTPASAAAITEAGLFNAASSGTMLARVVFDAVNKSVSDSLTVTWTVTVSV